MVRMKGSVVEQKFQKVKKLKSQPGFGSTPSPRAPVVFRDRWFLRVSGGSLSHSKSFDPHKKVRFGLTPRRTRNVHLWEKWALETQL